MTLQRVYLLISSACFGGAVAAAIAGADKHFRVGVALGLLFYVYSALEGAWRSSR